MDSMNFILQAERDSPSWGCRGKPSADAGAMDGGVGCLLVAADGGIGL